MRTRLIVTGEDLVALHLRQFGARATAEVNAADRTLASRQAQDASAAAHALGGVAAHVAPSITAQGDEVALGGAGWPMAAGAEFGRDRYHQFDPWTGSGETAGYFFVPAIEHSEADRLAEYDRAVATAVRSM